MLIVPQPDALTRPYWDGVARRELRLQTCLACAHAWHPPLPICPRCHSERIEWRPVAGGGTVYSFTVAHHAVHPAVVGKVPYLVALVTLDEGPRVVSGLPGVPFADVRIGMRVRLRFEEIAPGVVLPQFEPAPD
jgi:uncharacterized OB-fold protein